MYVRVRFSEHPEAMVIVDSKLTKIEKFRLAILDKFNVQPEFQRLFHGGKQLEDGYNFYDYNIKHNDVIQLVPRKPLEYKVKDEIKSEELHSPPNKYHVPPTSEVKHEDAVCSLYKVGDLIDTTQSGSGYWSEGTITGIVIDSQENCQNVGNLPSTSAGSRESDVKFSESSLQMEKICNNLLYKVKLEDDEIEDEEVCCKLSEIRPRARTTIDPENLKSGQTVMINYNIDSPGEIGDWYDFMFEEIKRRKDAYQLTGTLYLGSDRVPHYHKNIPVKDVIFAIEEPVPLKDRSYEYNQITSVPPPKRSQPVICKKCGDDMQKECRHCGCYICAGKETPSQIILCDECNKGFHLKCLTPPMTSVPQDDWYCECCKRDPNDVVAPGASVQAKKTVEGKRDWGRGMACIGKTKSCDMPTNHFGPIPGVEVGMGWRFRIQLSEIGLHRPSVSGIHGRDTVGAFSIVLSGGYEDDVDNGYEFTYTGSGGRDLSGNKRTAEQSSDQLFTRENRALARNCAVAPINEKGGDAGENWQKGKPVRVMRSYKMYKSFPTYAPREGIRYDGIYKVVKFYPEKGLSGFIVYKYLLRRDDPSPAPWEPNAKKFSIIYPDGYLEAEAQKKLLKQKESSKTTAKRKTTINKQSAIDSFGETKKLGTNRNHSLSGKVETPSKKSHRQSRAENVENETAISNRGDSSNSKPLLENISERASEINTKQKTNGYGLTSKRKINSSSLSENEENTPKKRRKQSRGGNHQNRVMKPAVKNSFGQSSISSTSSDDSSEEITEIRTTRSSKKQKLSDEKLKRKSKSSAKDKKAPSNQDAHSEDSESNKVDETLLSDMERKAIDMDKLNRKLWEECFANTLQLNKRDFIERVSEVFRCIICQDLVISPVTTPCLHNFCMSCIVRAFKVNKSKSCSYCCQSLEDFEPETNESLMNALRTLLPGYDAIKKTK